MSGIPTDKAIIRAKDTGEQTDGVMLLYTDVSFSFDLVRTATVIMAVLVLALSILLYCVQRYTVKILDSKDQRMKDFFANALHELKTPLMAIRSYVEGLEAGLVEQNKACSVITKETDRMASLVSTILDMLLSTFSNILTNRVRYAEKCITVSMSVQKTSGVLNIRIFNDGRPVTDEDAARLFERFYRGNGGQILSLWDFLQIRCDDVLQSYFFHRIFCILLNLCIIVR